MKAKRYRVCVERFNGFKSNNGYKWINVRGYPANIPYIEGAFVYKNVNDGLWRVTEPVSGFKIGNAATSKKVALANGKKSVEDGIRKYIHRTTLKAFLTSGRVKIVNAGKEFVCDENDL